MLSGEAFHDWAMYRGYGDPLETSDAFMTMEALSNEILNDYCKYNNIKTVFNI